VKAPVRRRRAATRPAGPPPVDETAVQIPAEPLAAEPAEPAEPVVAEPAAEPAVKRAAPRKRASRKKAVAPPPEPSPEIAAETSPEPPVEQAAAPTQTAATGTAASEAAPEAASAETPAPRRRRARKTAAAPIEVAPEPIAEPVAATVPEQSPEAAVEAIVEPIVEPEQVADPSAEAELVPEPESPAPDAPGPVFAMPLFQAPDMTAPPPRRRRAASRPAGPPQIVEEEVPTTGPQVKPAADADSSDQQQVTDVEDLDEDDAGEEGEEDDSSELARRRRRRRGGRGRRGRTRADGEPEPTDGEGVDVAEAVEDEAGEDGEDEEEPAEVGESAAGSRRRRRRRRRGTASTEGEPSTDDPPNTVVKVRESRRTTTSSSDDVTGLRGSTRLEAKKQRRREGREAGRRRPVITEAEFLARRESVDRVMVVREREGRTQIGVLEDGVLVEHYVARRTQTSMVGNVYLGRVQNVLPSMEAAFVDIGKGRNAVLYAGEVNWDAAGMEGQPKRIEHALKSGEAVLVQVTKDPIGHKGARLTSQISLPGRYLVYVPDGSMTGISRKLPDIERARLKKVLRQVVPENAGVIVRTAAEGASEEELERDVTRLQAQWEDVSRKAGAVNAPALLYGEPDLAIRVVRDIFNEDFARLIVSGDDAWDTLQGYIGHVAPDLVERLERWEGDGDVFASHRIDEQLAKALDRKVWLPSGGSLVIDRTEAMTVVDVNTGKFTGAGGNLEETVTKNNIEAAEEIVRQLRLRDIGGIIVVDFIDMVLESNRELVLRRLLECLGRDRTKHQVAEVTSLGLVQMTRKRVGSGLLEVFSETCEHCGGRGVIIHDEPVEKRQQPGDNGGRSGRSGGSSSGSGDGSSSNGNVSNGNAGNGNATADEPAPAAAAAAAGASSGRSRRSRRSRGSASSEDGGGQALAAGQ
jgi:ribonuclease E